MKNISQEIVGINNVVANNSKIMIENLLEMDESAKKYSLLAKGVYQDYFETAQLEFDSSLQKISQLVRAGYSVPPGYANFLKEYENYKRVAGAEKSQKPLVLLWINEKSLQKWLDLLVEVRDLNRGKIEQSLVEIHDQALKSTRNGLIGFALSIVASVFGVWFISKSIIIPLRQLTQGLRTLSKGDFSLDIKVTSKDEFQDLAVAYNEMSSELREQENLRADFIATLSHEIRTPLSSIQESVNMIVEEIMGRINEKQRKFLTIASAEISRINELLDHLMHVSKLEANLTIGKVDSIDLKQVVDDSISRLSSQSDTKSISIQKEFQSTLFTLQGCRNEVLQVLLNVIGNAVKFSPFQSKILISVLKSKKSGYVLIRINDEGLGIPDHERSMIFTKYYRSKSVRKHMNGVGLGLYISRKIVQEMGGSISASNNLKKGCTFTISLPLS